MHLFNQIWKQFLEKLITIGTDEVLLNELKFELINKLIWKYPVSSHKLKI